MPNNKSFFFIYSRILFIEDKNDSQFLKPAI